ncbi:MAG: ComF family protein [Bacteroidetes bacterium]|nr:ComF family protein [Bacteroidota bacterium]
MNPAARYINDFLHLFFPHVCIGCGIDILNNEDELCAQCISQLPETGFLSTPGNLVEKKFYGRLKIEKGGSAFYFNKASAIRETILELKYKSNQQAGKFLGKLLGYRIATSARFNDVDAIIPLPLNEKKLYQRGYNQSYLIAEGIVSVWKRPIIDNAVTRYIFTETQTKKDRIARWQTMEKVFVVNNPAPLQNKHILLVDDVITTGATLEACGTALLQMPGLKISVATVACTI